MRMPGFFCVVITAGASELDFHVHHFGRLGCLVEAGDGVGDRKRAFNQMLRRDKHLQHGVDLVRLHGFWQHQLPGSPVDVHLVAGTHLPPRPGAAQKAVKREVVQRRAAVDAPDLRRAVGHRAGAAGDVQLLVGVWGGSGLLGGGHGGGSEAGRGRSD